MSGDLGGDLSGLSSDLSVGLSSAVCGEQRLAARDQALEPVECFNNLRVNMTVKYLRLADESTLTASPAASSAALSTASGARWTPIHARLVRVLTSACVALGMLGTVQIAHAAPLDTMIKAVKFDDIAAARKMLAKGVDPNAVDDQGNPLLVIAAREKSNEVAQLLIQDKRTDIEKLDRAGENAMMLAAISQDPPLVRALIDKGAEVNKKGWAPLHYAASVGNDEIVKMLLDASAYIDAASPNGTTPLMMAARGGHVSTIALLVDQGADPTLKNQIGLSAGDFAKRYNETDAVTALAADVEAWNARHAPGAAQAPRKAQ